MHRGTIEMEFGDGSVELPRGGRPRARRRRDCAQLRNAGDTRRRVPVRRRQGRLCRPRRTRARRRGAAGESDRRLRRRRAMPAAGSELTASPRGSCASSRDLAIPLAEITLRASRSSGPGGQHANVTASRVEAIFDVLASSSLSEAQRERLLARAGPRVAAVAQDARSQARNRQLALERLGERLRNALARPALASRHGSLGRLARTEARGQAPQEHAQGRAPASARRWTS